MVARLRAAGSVFAEDEADLLVSAAADEMSLQHLLERRCAGDPLEQVLGWAEFCGLRVPVERGVFVPRLRTQHLVRCAHALLDALPAGPISVDLCCGSGAITLALAQHRPDAQLWAVDVDERAAGLAGRTLAGVAQVLHGDLFAPLPAALRGHVDVVTVSAPYVPTDEIALLPREAREFEDPIALDGGSDGLAVYRAVVPHAGTWLAPRGALLMETSRHQAEAAVSLAAEHGFEAVVSTDDDLMATVVIAVAP